MTASIEWVGDPGRLRTVAREWEVLAREEPSPFAQHAWFAAWWEAFGTGQLQVGLLWADGELRAALPLLSHRGRLTALANYHTPVFVAPARERESLRVLVDAAIDLRPDELTIHAVSESDPLREQFAAASRQRQRLLLVEQVHRSPRVETRGDFENYVSGRGSRFKTVARRWRKLHREHEVRFRFEDSPGDLERELQRGYEVEASGWKGQQGTAILSSRQTEAFYTGVARAYHARGELRLIWLDVDRQPAAFNLCLLRAGRLYLLKTGMQERFRPQAAGLLIHYGTVQRCFELGLESYELLGGDDPYKGYFATAACDHLRLRSYRRDPVGLARYATRRVGRPVVHAVRARLAARPRQGADGAQSGEHDH